MGEHNPVPNIDLTLTLTAVEGWYLSNSRACPEMPAHTTRSRYDCELFMHATSGAGLLSWLDLLHQLGCDIMIRLLLFSLLHEVTAAVTKTCYKTHLELQKAKKRPGKLPSHYYCKQISKLSNVEQCCALYLLL